MWPMGSPGATFSCLNSGCTIVSWALLRRYQRCQRGTQDPDMLFSLAAVTPFSEVPAQAFPAVCEQDVDLIQCALWLPGSISVKHHDNSVVLCHQAAEARRDTNALGGCGQAAPTPS